MPTPISQSYGQVTLHLGFARFNFTATNALKLMLVSPSYAPNIDTHDFRNDVTNEISAAGYTSGGVVLTGVGWTYDSGNNWSVLTADTPTFSPLAATVRYAVVYGNVGSAATDPLVGYIDLDEDVDMTLQGLNLSWPATGILRVELV